MVPEKNERLPFMDLRSELCASSVEDIGAFCRNGSGLRLRRYQLEAARAIVNSVIHNLGHSIVVIFPRQSGKNELQAQLEAYLLTIYSLFDAEIVKVSPTWKPQTLNAMRRLRRVLDRNLFTFMRWSKESGYIYRLGPARIVFLSAHPGANVVGATANMLLECDEAQDVLPERWDKDFSPMAASTNATRVFFGTMWTSTTLLARELRLARSAEAQDGMRRVFLIDAHDVAAEVPAYWDHVQEQVARLGERHPMVLTQYFSQEIDTGSGMFTPLRLALMQGDHPPQSVPVPGEIYAILIDVAGEAEQNAARPGSNPNPRQDSTALTILQVDLSTLADELLEAPTYRVVNRFQWTGVKHSRLYGQIRSLVEVWHARHLVIDATGVGAGLASFLERAYPGKVTAYKFSTKSKSALGWGFLAVVETGRYKEYDANRQAGEHARELLDLQEEFWQQAEYCQMDVLEGANREMRWGVPDGLRSPAGGEMIHDDLLISAAFCAVLDGKEWGLAYSQVVAPNSIFEGMADAF
jgi:hypothetical protein